MLCCVRKERADTGSILYRILNGVPQNRRCSCAKKNITFRFPESIHATASEVLVKTLGFVKSLPCFRGLPPQDQLLLVRHGWAPLVVLGLAQEHSVDLETVETQQMSLLHRILTHGQDLEQDRHVIQTDVTCAKVFVDNCRSMSVSSEEYAFLKGAVLFSSDLEELLSGDYIQTLQTESERALYEHRPVHRAQGLCRLLAAARSLNPETVAALFFKTTRNIQRYVLAVFVEI